MDHCHLHRIAYYQIRSATNIWTSIPRRTAGGSALLLLRRLHFWSGSTVAAATSALLCSASTAFQLEADRCGCDCKLSYGRPATSTVQTLRFANIKNQKF
ncbi:hypothetical protein Y032_0040g289 [Ancylostoma ceylanicum]|uniref:Uncharacterized protein n=1 Tax=Ancylostoma ceylanicum TaxID=53326 RepID=A0A016UJ79_9BILA|nr:hypothetical protein Y032_0040g289 [Ancylostoma ceylanicum]